MPKKSLVAFGWEEMVRAPGQKAASAQATVAAARRVLDIFTAVTRQYTPGRWSAQGCISKPVHRQESLSLGVGA